MIVVQFGTPAGIGFMIEYVLTNKRNNMKNYKIGDRIFYESYDGTIGSDIIIDIEPDTYTNRHGHDVEFNNLIVWRSGNCSSSIEDYNTLSKSNPKVKKFVKGIRESLEAKFDDLYESTGAKTKKEKSFVRKALMWAAKNLDEDTLKFADLLNS